MESERRAEEFSNLSQLFIDALDVEEVIAHLLVTEGFTSIEEVAFIPVGDLTSIEGFDENVAEELHNRARNWLETKQKENQKKLKDLGMDQTLIQFAAQNPVIKQEWLEKFGESKVLTLDDFADLSTVELLEILGNSGLNSEEAGNLIMAARASWAEE